MKESEKKYHGLFEYTTDGIFVLDAHGDILDMNTRMCEILDVMKSSFTNKNLFSMDLLTAKSLPVVIQQFEQLLSEKIAVSYTTEIKNRQPPPVTVEVAWWEGWKSLTLSLYLFLSSFSLAAISSPPPPVTLEVAWWEGWKLFSNTSFSSSVLSTVTSSHPKSRARRLALSTSPLLLLSLLLNVIFFLNVCTFSVFPPDVSSNVLRSEPVSLAPGSSEVGRVLPLSIPVTPSRTLAETPWFPMFTLPVIPLAYCPLSSLCSRKGPRQVFYLLYFSFLLSSILLLPVPRVGRMVPFEEPILIYKPG